MNTAFQEGGIVGESKADILAIAQRHLGSRVAPFICVRRNGASASSQAQDFLSELASAGLSFPLVAKPDKGCRGAGVRPLYHRHDLERYLEAFPAHSDLILQHMVQSEGEAGVFYVRNPKDAKGRILSLTLKYFPYVIGDGKTSLRDLILDDPRAGRLSHLYFPRFHDQLENVPAVGEAVRLAFAGNHSKGTIFRDGATLVTPQMEAMFDRLSQKIDGFYFGRYDIRFDDLESLRRGEENFSIIEINGAGAEVTHIWDADTSLMKAWRDVIHQYYLAWKIGATNQKSGAKALSIKAFWTDYRNEKNASKLYPSTY
ncbi:MAG: hypothetical protein K2Q12_11465 [Rickettsiales bacterium]|nr:hypothetical protein [Rickettsiales bacterium]